MTRPPSPFSKTRGKEPGCVGDLRAQNGDTVEPIETRRISTPDTFLLNSEADCKDGICGKTHILKDSFYPS